MRLLFFPDRSGGPPKPPEAIRPHTEWPIPFWVIYLVLVVAIAGDGPFWLKLIIGLVLTVLLSWRGAFD